MLHRLIDSFQDEDTSFVDVLAEQDADIVSKLQLELDDKNRVRSRLIEYKH
jgi:hypothetical protein